MWFKRFKSRIFYVKDTVHSGRIVTDKISAIFDKVEQDRLISSYEIAEELDVDHKTVLRDLRKTGYKENLTFGYQIYFHINNNRNIFWLKNIYLYYS